MIRVEKTLGKKILSREILALCSTSKRQDATVPTMWTKAEKFSVPYAEKGYVTK